MPSKLQALLEQFFTPPPDVVAGTARKTLADYQAMMVDGWDWLPADSRQFKHLDLAWYRRETREIETRKFRALGDLRLSAGPSSALTTFARKFLSHDGRTRGDLFMAPGPTPDLDKRVVVFCSEVGQTWIVTTNAEDFWDPVPGFESESLPPQTPASKVWLRHKAKLAKATKSGSKATVMATLDDVIAAENRGQKWVTEFRRRTGYPTAAALERLGADAPFARALEAEMKRLVEEQARPAKRSKRKSR